MFAAATSSPPLLKTPTDNLETDTETKTVIKDSKSGVSSIDPLKPGEIYFKEKDHFIKLNADATRLKLFPHSDFVWQTLPSYNLTSLRIELDPGSPYITGSQLAKTLTQWNAEKQLLTSYVGVYHTPRANFSTMSVRKIDRYQPLGPFLGKTTLCSEADENDTYQFDYEGFTVDANKEGHILRFAAHLPRKHSLIGTEFEPFLPHIATENMEFQIFLVGKERRPQFFAFASETIEPFSPVGYFYMKDKPFHLFSKKGGEPIAKVKYGERGRVVRVQSCFEKLTACCWASVYPPSVSADTPLLTPSSVSTGTEEKKQGLLATRTEEKKHEPSSPRLT